MSSVAVRWQFPATIHLKGGHKTPTQRQSRMPFREQQAEVKHRATKSRILHKPPFGHGELMFFEYKIKKTNTDILERMNEMSWEM